MPDNQSQTEGRTSRCYMVRAMFSREGDFKCFFDNSVVAVGWSDFDFSKYQNEEGVRQIVFNSAMSCLYNGNKRLSSKNANQAARFKGIKSGDYIIVPHGAEIALAEAGEEEIYSEKYGPQDLANQRRVKYVRNDDDGKIKFIPRNGLIEGLRRRLKVRGNYVADLSDFQEEIEELFKKQLPSGFVGSKESQLTKKRLLENIQQGKTALQAEGNGLEILVKDLLRIMGYTNIESKNVQECVDANILANRQNDPFCFEDIDILVQVKQHCGEINSDIQQFLATLALPEYRDCSGVLVTSSLVPNNEELAATHDIIIIDGEDLVDIIMDNVDKLDEDLVKQLGLYKVWRLMVKGR